MEIPSNHPNPPKSMIKPIKYRQSKTIDQQNMIKFITHHPKNLKTTYSPLPHHIDQTKQRHRQPIKRLSKIFETNISSAEYSLNGKTAFQNEYFTSRIRSQSNSLSFFDLQAWEDINEARSKAIFQSLNSLKSLRRFELSFYYCQFPATDDLHSLFKRLLYFKKMTHFSLFAIHCQDVGMDHLKALCSPLARSSQLQSLTLVFNGGDQLLDTLIPALSKLTSLTKFRLSLEGDNVVQAEGLQRLFLALSAIETLTDITLHLNNCETDDETTTLEPLAESLQCLNPSSIRKLSLDLYKNFTDKDFARFSQALKKLTSLQILHLGLPSSQNFTEKGLNQLSSTLRRLASLTSLSLTFSEFTENQTLAFKSLQNLVSLKLSFQNPYPSHDQVRQLSSRLKALKSSLKFLEIRFAEQSSLPDPMIENLADALKELTLLKHFLLDLTSASTFTFKGIEALGLAIQRLSNLSSLSLIFAKSQEVDEKAVNALSQALQSLQFLHSIELDFFKCYQINSKGNGFQNFFAAFKEMKKICKFKLRLPFSPDLSHEVERLKQRFDLRTLVFLNCLEIRTL